MVAKEVGFVLIFTHMTGENWEEKHKFLWEVCGHEKIVSYLKSAIATDRVNHAYIFAGPSGLGKATVADRFIKTLYCQGQGEYKPCGQCPACRQVEAHTHPDVYRVGRVINEKTGKFYREIVIDQMRDLKMKLSQGTLLSSWKIAIIEDADYLNVNAANSLLKVLEEPTRKTVIILLVSDLSQMLKTITSRVQVLNFLPVSHDEIKDYLLSQEISNDKAQRIANLSLGKPRLAIKMIEDNDYYNTVTTDIKSFGEIFELDMFSRLKKMDSLLDWDKDESINISRLNLLFDHWLMGLRDLIMLSTNNSRLMAIVAGERSLAAGTANRLLRVYDLISTARGLLDRNISSKNVLENLIINI